MEHLSWSSNGQQLAIASGRYVHIYTSDANENWKSDEHPSTVSAIFWSKPDELASACYGQVLFYDVKKKQENQKLQWQGSLISMVLNPAGDIVACGSQDNSVHFWRRDTGKDAEMTGYPGKPSQLAFDQSGQFLATGGSDQIIVWNFQGDESLPDNLCCIQNPPFRFAIKAWFRIRIKMSARLASETDKSFWWHSSGKISGLQ